MLTPIRQLQHDIELRHHLAVSQRARAREQSWALRECWHSTLARPRNLVLSFGAGITYGMLRRTQVRLPGGVDVWRLARPLLVSTAMAWWTQRHAAEGAAEGAAAGAAEAVRDAQVSAF